MSEEKKNVDDKDLKEVTGGVERVGRQSTGNMTGVRSDDGGVDAPNLDDR